MNRYVVPETGQYLVWASDPDRRETRVLIDGVPAADRTAASTLGPFGDATLSLQLDLVEESEITTSPPGAAMSVRRAPGEN